MPILLWLWQEKLDTKSVLYILFVMLDWRRAVKSFSHKIAVLSIVNFWLPTTYLHTLVAPSFIMTKNIKRKKYRNIETSKYWIWRILPILDFYIMYFHCSFSLLQILNQKWTKLRPKQLVSIFCNIFYNSSTIVW